MAEDNEDEEDCWDAFGSSSDEDDEGSDKDDNDEIFNGAGSSNASASAPIDTKTASTITLHLSQTFLKHNPQVRLSDRTVAVVRIVMGREASSDAYQNDNDYKCMVSKHLEQRQILVVHQTLELEHRQENFDEFISSKFAMLDAMTDALIVLNDTRTVNRTLDEKKCDDDNSATFFPNKWLQVLIDSILCPGGILIFSKSLDSEGTNHDFFDIEEKLIGSETTVLCSASTNNSGTIQWIARRKKLMRAHVSTCPWLSSSHSVASEEERLHLATVSLSSHEMAASPIFSKRAASDPKKVRQSSRLTEHSIRKAVSNMKKYGYCILPGLLDTNECLDWGNAVLECVHDASKILLERDGVDIYNPQSSNFEPQSYREMSMREDLRMDLRHGPSLWKLRAQKEGTALAGGNSILLSATENRYGDGLFLRGHPSLLEILRRTMNPGSSSTCDDPPNQTDSKPLYLGNIGRWNFGGTGNNGSYQDLRISPIGGIVSLPGSADQALHADTPHLFEHIPDLPAHYINIFAPCTAFDNAVGGTAFIHGSHNLSFTAKHYDANHNTSFYPFLVRPRVSLGDVILFDCRILHFGLANTSRSTERCICYVNTWHDWFHDAKNWDKNQAIFDETTGEN